MGPRSLYIFYSFSAVTDFRRQILTFKVGPRTERVKIRNNIITMIYILRIYMINYLKVKCKAFEKKVNIQRAIIDQPTVLTKAL